MRASTTRRQHSQPLQLSFSRGGLLVVCGPPLGGKGPLAARLHDDLPGATKLEVADNLSQDEAVDLSNRPNGAKDETAEGRMLRKAVRHWQRQPVAPPIVIVCARFATPSSRLRAAEVARKHEAHFLLVEATSSVIRSLRRVSRLLLPADETVVRLNRYEEATNAYQAVSGTERARLPALALSGVLKDLDEAARRVLQAWVR